MSLQAKRALKSANDVRVRRAELKDRIHADPTWSALKDVVAGELEPELVAGMKVVDLVIQAPGIGPSKARAILRAAGVDRVQYAGLLFKWLTPNRRTLLIHELERAHTTQCPGVLERRASRDRRNRGNRNHRKDQAA